MKKNVFKAIGFAMLASGMIFLSCKKENVAGDAEAANKEINTNQRAAADELGEFLPKDDRFASLFEVNREANTERFTVNANEPIAIEIPGVISIRLEENALVRADGSLVEGEVDVFVNAITNRGEMLIQDRGTSGIDESGAGVGALQSAGEFFIRVEQDGEELGLLKPMDVEVGNGPVDPDMRLFVEAEGTGDDLVWELDREQELEFGKGGERGYAYGYQILPDLGNQWAGCNIDRFITDWACPKSHVSVNVPPGYDPSNTEVYLIPCGTQGQLANFDNWDAATNSFEEHGGQICDGTCVHFILVTNVGGGLQYEIHSSVIINPGSHTEVFTAPFASITASALAALINALP